MNAPANSWLITSHPKPRAQVRLFCFPYAGAGALAFRPWGKILGDDIEVCAIELPGRETRFREPPASDVAMLVQSLVRVLYPFHLDKPFAFFGHSLGAIVAFELTRALTAQYGIQPLHLIVSGRLAPQAKDPRPPIHVMPEPAFVHMLRALGGTPDLILDDPELAPMRAIIRADFALNERYVYTPGTPLHLPLTAYGGTTDPKVTEGDLLLWQEQSAGRFARRIFPGDHFFIHSSRDLVLQALTQDLLAPLP